MSQKSVTRDLSIGCDSHTADDMQDENGDCGEAEDARVLIERASKSPLKGGSNARINLTATNPISPNNPKF